MQPAPSTHPDRSLLLIGAGILALVAIAAVAVLLIGGREPAQLPADSAEGAIQRYLAAFDEGDFEAAHAYFSDEVRSDMELDEYERVIRDYGAFPPQASRRVLFDRTEADGERARVHLTVEEYYGGGPFGGGETYRSPREIRMVREAGSWRIDELLIGIEPGPGIAPDFYDR